MRPSLLLLPIVLLPLSCGVAGVESEAASAPPAPLDAAFARDLEAVAASYADWGRVDDMWRWAPELCMAPPAPAARFSASGDADTHGGKLYALHALDPASYGGYPDSLPPGRIERPLAHEYDQILVKESWRAEPTSEEIGSSAGGGIGPAWLRPAERDGELWMAGERLDLYVMLHTDPATPGTDEGWVYGTVAPDGTTVTSAGLVPSCMSCHTRAPHGRLFGLPDAPAPPR